VFRFRQLLQQFEFTGDNNESFMGALRPMNIHAALLALLIRSRQIDILAALSAPFLALVQGLAFKPW
jgi:hypothetical protein